MNSEVTLQKGGLTTALKNNTVNKCNGEAKPWNDYGKYNMLTRLITRRPRQLLMIQNRDSFCCGARTEAGIPLGAWKKEGDLTDAVYYAPGKLQLPNMGKGLCDLYQLMDELTGNISGGTDGCSLSPAAFRFLQSGAWRIFKLPGRNLPCVTSSNRTVSSPLR